MIISLNNYAQALYEVGVDSDEVMPFYEAMQSFCGVIQEADVQSVFEYGLTHPDVLVGIWDVLAKNYSVQFVNFLRVLQEGNVILQFKRIVDEYREILDNENYITTVDIVSPYQLDVEEKEHIVLMLKEKYNNHLELHFEVDPSLIDGMVVKAKNDIFDTSIKSKLDRILNQGGIGR